MTVVQPQPNMPQQPVGTDPIERQVFQQLNEIFDKSKTEDAIRTSMSKTKFGNCNNQAEWVLACMSDLMGENYTMHPVQGPEPMDTSTSSSTTTTFESASRTPFTNPPDITKSTANAQTGSDAPVVDLTNAPDTGVSKEEQEVSKAIEESIRMEKERQNIGIFGPYFRDPENPHERKREGETPVGLKNIGNTCWFNVVIQALFTIPAFRDQILNFKQAEPADKENVAPNQTPPIEFVLELRQLFAKLLASKRQYIDPTAVLQIIRQHDTLKTPADTPFGAQQDATEMSLILLEWLEDAFKLCQPSTSQTEEQQEENATQNLEESNPIRKLFYGTQVEEEVGTESAPRESKCLQHHYLHLAGCDNFHSSMEAVLWPDKSSDQPRHTQSWFRSLPPVLLFSLRRFDFNPATNTTEKVHRPFSFPLTFYSDRYLHKNKEIVSPRREQVRTLRAKLKLVKDELLQYENFGASDRKIPLGDILRSTRNFAGLEEEAETAAASPSQSEGSVQTDTTIVQSEGSPSCDTSADESSVTVDEPMETDKNQSLPIVEEPMQIQPKAPALEDNKRVILRDVLNEWIEMVDSKVNELRTTLENMSQSIEGAYTSPELRNDEYRLHAVMVHEGQADMGHYWAFVNEKDNWKKYNDRMVTNVSWTDVMRESYGEHKVATSAYCLLYVRSDCKELFEDAGPSSLPPDLLDLVDSDNAAFVVELADFDRASELPSLSPHPSLPVSENSNLSAPTLDPEQMGSDHAKAAAEQASFNVVMQNKLLIKSEKEVREAIQETCDRLLGSYSSKSKQVVAGGVSEESQTLDPRMEHIVVFVYCAGLEAKVSPDVLKLLVFESLAAWRSETESERSKEVQESSYLMLQELLKTPTFEDEDVRNALHRHYHMFLEGIAILCYAILEYEKQDFNKCLKYYHCAETFNKTLKQFSPDSENHLIYPELLSNILRSASVMATKKLMSQLDVSVLSKNVAEYKQYVLPLVKHMDRLGQPIDKQCCENISALWLSFTSNCDLQSDRSTGPFQTISDITTDLLELEKRQSNFELPKCSAKVNLHIPSLGAQLKKALVKAKDFGLLDTEELGKRVMNNN